MRAGMGVAVALACAACGSTEAGDVGASGSGGAPGDAECGPELDVPSVRVRGTIQDFLKGGVSPLGGVSACWYEPKEACAITGTCQVDNPAARCTQTNDQGAYCLRVPANRILALTFQTEGYVPLLSPVYTGSEDLKNYWRFLPLGLAEDLARLIGAHWPLDGNGAVFARALGVEGATMRSDVSAIGPVYGNEADILDLGLTSTVRDGIAVWGDVPPGNVFVSVDPFECGAHVWGWPAAGASGPADAAGRTLVVPGFFSELNLRCQ